MSRLMERMERELDGRAARHLRRELRLAQGVDCSSNDYLGLSRHPALLDAVRDAAERGVPAGSGGSRLLSGHHAEHAEAEELFARFIGRERALLFSSGFAANLALLSTLPSRRDLIVLDGAAHASLKEGARASLAAKRSFRHNSIDDLERAMRDRDSFEEVFIVVEGVYSMDGDIAPLDAMAKLAERYDAHLVVDEAHATGLYGPRLRGVHESIALERPPLVTIHPCGKALGSAGAFIAADRLLIDYLINNARPFLFSTSPSPLATAGLTAALRLLPEMTQRAGELRARAARLRDRLDALDHWSVIPSDSPIIPIITGDDESAVRASALVMELGGFDLRPIRPPTVPIGTSRLRISLTWHINDEDAERLADVIITAEKMVGAMSHA